MPDEHIQKTLVIKTETDTSETVKEFRALGKELTSTEGLPDKAETKTVEVATELLTFLYFVRETALMIPK